MVGILLTLIAAVPGICLAFSDPNHGRASSNLTGDMHAFHKDARK